MVLISTIRGYRPSKSRDDVTFRGGAHDSLAGGGAESNRQQQGPGVGALLIIVDVDLIAIVNFKGDCSRGNRHPTYSSAPTMSSYDALPDETGIITQDEMRRSMQLVRLQIATPLSVLMTIGASLVCALAVKPGLADINKAYPTRESRCRRNAFDYD